MKTIVASLVRLAPGVLLCCALAIIGGLVAAQLALPVPGAVLGLIAYLLLLRRGGGWGWSRPGAELLLRWLGALIVPALVGLTAYAGVLAAAAAPLAVVLVTTTLVTALTTAAIFRLAGGRG